MSPRAAWRLESLGFTKVFDYMAGKADWLASGLPVEGELADYPRAGTVSRTDVSTCSLSDRLGDVRDRTHDADQNVCVVVNDDRVVLGRLRGKTLDADPGATLESVMESGPTTIRPDEPLEAIVERMRDQRVGSILVTTSDGRLVGILYREDAERVLAETIDRSRSPGAG